MTNTVALQQMKSVEDVQTALREARKVLPVGAQTKPGMSSPPEEVLLADMRGLNGIVEYEPAEYTITAWAGTPINQLNAAVAANGQYLPFDPVLAKAGATAGGTVAAGVSGSGRLRYGGIRDFFLGTRFVDGQGRLIRGGGKVVKNAAGFDFPKLLIGSMGRLGIMLDVTFKVFPCPPAYSTLLTPYSNLVDAISAFKSLAVSPIEIAALDLDAAGDDGVYTLVTRIGGAVDLLPEQMQRLANLLPESQCITAKADADYWSNVTEFSWADQTADLVKTPLTPNMIPAIDSQLAKAGAKRRYTVAGNVLWISWKDELDVLSNLLSEQGVSGVVLRGAASSPLIGATTRSAFTDRVSAAMDPNNKFLPVYSD